MQVNSWVTACLESHTSVHVSHTSVKVASAVSNKTLSTNQGRLSSTDQEQRRQQAFVEAPDALLLGNLLDSMCQASVGPGHSPQVSE